MSRLLIAAALVLVATAIALFLRRRRPAAPTQPRWAVPTQLDRDDFEGIGAPWLLVVFTSATCESCDQATAKAAVVASAQVAYQEVSYQQRKDLHHRYGIEAVPTILLAGEDGVVRVSFVGVPTATDLWAAVAEAREPRTTPEPDLGLPQSG